jgi:FKBP-type peptidyl-prolyl cis-trans isomerase
VRPLAALALLLLGAVWPLAAAAGELQASWTDHWSEPGDCIDWWRVPVSLPGSKTAAWCLREKKRVGFFADNEDLASFQALYSACSFAGPVNMSVRSHPGVPCASDWKVSPAKDGARAAELAAEEKRGKVFAGKFSREIGARKIKGGGWIKHVAEGTGAPPAAEDTVGLSYKGMLLDGYDFDGTARRARADAVPLSLILPCLAQGIELMRPGGKARIVCPPDAAYGDRGRPPLIPGGATLVFDVALIDDKGPIGAIQLIPHDILYGTDP